MSEKATSAQRARFNRSFNAAHRLECAINRLSIGVTLGYRSNHERLFQLNDDRYRHTAIIGRTGAGKSNHMRQLERQDIQGDAGVIVIAAHEEDALYPAACIPDERLTSSVIVDFGNEHFLPCLNPLDVDPRDDAAVDRAVGKAIELVSSTSQHDWTGPRFDQAIRMAIYLLLDSPDESRHSILSIARCLTDQDYVMEMTRTCRRADVVRFWNKEYARQTNSGDFGELLTWTTSKLADFQTDKTLRALFGPGRRTLDLRRVVNEGQVLIALVPEQRLSSAAASRIHSWLASELKDAVMGRSQFGSEGEASYFGAFGGTGAPAFNPCHVYVDEFEKMASPAFATLLAEARKRCVSFTLAFQSLGQMEVYDRKTGSKSREMLQAILANVGTFVCYPMGVEDAQVMARQLHVEPERLEEIERYRPLVAACLDNERMPPCPLDVERAPNSGNWTSSDLEALAMWMIGTGIWLPVGKCERMYAETCRKTWEQMRAHL